MLDFGFYNMDCMEGMKEFPDKYFDLGFDYVGFEIDEEYYRQAKERLEAEMAQIRFEL